MGNRLQGLGKGFELSGITVSGLGLVKFMLS